MEAVAAAPKQEPLALVLREPSASYGSMQAAQPSPALPLNVQPDPLQPSVTPAQAQFSSVCEILRRELAEPKSEAEVAKLLHVSKPQAKAWLTQLVKDGELEKTARPLRYRVAGSAGRLL
jgi:hypothetical protein